MVESYFLPEYLKMGERDIQSDQYDTEGLKNDSI